MKQQPKGSGRGLPVVVQLGFAGSRKLFDAADHPDVDAAEFYRAVEAYLTERLKRLPKLLGFCDRHFLCGISQLAAGADMRFTRACQILDIPQRIFLPEHSDEFLSAIGHDGVPDFTEAERGEAAELLASPHVIEKRIVGESHDREARFADVNREIARISDVIVCLIREGAGNRPGSARDLMDRGIRGDIPVLEIRIAVMNGRAVFSEEWHKRDKFRAPALPSAIAAARLPETAAPASQTSISVCSQVLLDLGDAQANWQRKLFKYVAGVIIGTHVLATILAVLGLAFHASQHPSGTHHTASASDADPATATHAPAHRDFESIIPGLLCFELLSLAVGFGVHHYLHHSHACHRWAMSRVVAEVARSVQTFAGVHIYLEHLFVLPFPASLCPLLRTINVLHLRSARSDTPWEEKRKTYVEKRLTDPGAQIEFFTKAAARAARWLKFYHRTFLVCSGGAILATSTELALSHRVDGHVLKAALGGLAIALPVLAVAALSLAAAMDLEARKHTYGEMLEFLKKQTDRLSPDRLSNATEGDFVSLLLETESRLLGEVANWYSRRAFTGVA